MTSSTAARRGATPAAEGAKGGGAGPTLRQIALSRNVLQSRATARVVDLVSEGEIAGLVNGLQSVFFDDTPVQNADGSFNIHGVTIEERDGLPDQEALAGFPAVENEVAVGAEVTQAASVSRTITDADVDAVRVTVRAPALFRQLEGGDLVGVSVTLAIDVQAGAGPLVEIRRDALAGKSTSPYERAWRVELPPGGPPWTVRVRRITIDRTDPAWQNKTFWARYTEITDLKLSYPDSALYGVTVDAEQFGSAVPVRSYEIKGIILQVPSNYDPLTRIYTGLWDGTFKRAWSDNPAWVLYDLLTSTRYGLGGFIDAAQIDKFGLYAIAQYCDELVDDGFGGTEPRFTFNGVLGTRREAFAVLQAIASAFRGMLYWGAGVVTAVQDAPADPVKLVTPANVIGGLFNYEGSGLKARHSVALVRWNDPADGYDAAIEPVEDAALIEALGYRPVEVAAIGTTSRGQARRFGKWLLDSEDNETETVSYTAALDHADARPGEIIAIADPHVAGVRFGGRIKAATTLQATLDAAVTLDGGESYTLSVVLPDGTVEDRGVTTGPGATDVLDLASALGDTPLVGAMWVLTATNLAPRRFRVVTVAETADNLYQVTALLHDATKYARVEQGLLVEAPPFTAVPSGPLPAPQGLAVREYVYQAGVAVKSAVTVSWEAARDARIQRYEVFARAPDEAAFGRIEVTPAVSVDLLDVNAGAWSFRVRGLTADNEAGPVVTLDTTLSGPPAPAVLTGLAVNVVGDQAHLSWTPPADLTVAYHQVRFQPVTSGAAWDDATVLVERVPGASSSATVPALAGSYLVKAFDSSGAESADAAIAVSTIAALEGLNVVETVVEGPAFAGAKDRIVFDTGLGALRIDSASDVLGWTDVLAIDDVFLEGGLAAEGVYDFAGTVDLLAVFTSRVTVSVGGSVTNLEDDIIAAPDVLALGDVFGVVSGDYDTIIEMRTTEDDPAGAPAWSGWMPPGLGDYTARAFEFRAWLQSHAPGVTPLITALSAEVDMPDRVVGGEDLLCPAVGLSVGFLPAFNVRPAIAVTGQNMATGDYVAVTNQTRSGFDIRFFDSTNTGVARTFDYVAKGYGKEM